MALSILVGRQPDVVVTRRTILSINKVSDTSDIILHAIESMHATRMCIDLKLISASLANIVAVLVVKFDTIEANVEQIAVGRIQIYLE